MLKLIMKMLKLKMKLKSKDKLHEVEVEDELHEVVFKFNLKKLKNVKLKKINRKLKKLKITLKLCFDQIVIKSGLSLFHIICEFLLHRLHC